MERDRVCELIVLAPLFLSLPPSLTPSLSLFLSFLPHYIFVPLLLFPPFFYVVSSTRRRGGRRRVPNNEENLQPTANSSYSKFIELRQCGEAIVARCRQYYTVYSTFIITLAAYFIARITIETRESQEAHGQIHESIRENRRLKQSLLRKKCYGRNASVTVSLSRGRCTGAFMCSTR